MFLSQMQELGGHFWAQHQLKSLFTKKKTLLFTEVQRNLKLYF